MVEQRFLTLTDVGEILNISPSQTRALVRSGELRPFKLAGETSGELKRACSKPISASAMP